MEEKTINERILIQKKLKEQLILDIRKLVFHFELKTEFKVLHLYYDETPLGKFVDLKLNNSFE